LLLLEQSPDDAQILAALMRAAHSLKGAARLVQLETLVQFCHLIEDFFVAVQKGRITIDERHIDLIFRAEDLLAAIARLPVTSITPWIAQQTQQIHILSETIRAVIAGKEPPEVPARYSGAFEKEAEVSDGSLAAKAGYLERGHERILRVNAKSLNRLMGLAGEALVESRWLYPFSSALMRLKKDIIDLSDEVASFSQRFREVSQNEGLVMQIEAIKEESTVCRRSLTTRLAELELFINRHSSLSDRLYREVIDSRMGVFGDILDGFPRLVRDLGKQLNKKVRLEIVGRSTPVDRDILDRLEVPLAHMVRNAVDHGIETPEVRVALGKPPEGVVRIEAQHIGGQLLITVSDDGAGIDLAKIKQIILVKGLATQEVVGQLSEHELIDFLFLPGFSTAERVSEISGRGVGLNILQTMVQDFAGRLQTTSIPGQGVTISLQLPLTLSVIHALLVEVEKEPYALPLGRIERALLLPPSKIEMVQDKQCFIYEGKSIGLVSAAQILDITPSQPAHKALSVVVIRDKENTYGIVFDAFLGEKELVVQEPDERLGKVENISSGAYMEDGTPVLIFDVEDLFRSIERIITGQGIQRVSTSSQAAPRKIKKILVIDDSLTVREVECRLLRQHGYQVDIAVNGIDGWNAIRTGDYDLVVTDVDMPRMSGIELVRAIKGDPRLKSVPVMIVSYKERDQDREQGLGAGADLYLTKSEYQDEQLVEAVLQLIGEARMEQKGEEAP
jgi:two-component system sensor histidine kinase and response regulator WspE